MSTCTPTPRDERALLRVIGEEARTGGTGGGAAEGPGQGGGGDKGGGESGEL